MKRYRVVVDAQGRHSVEEHLGGLAGLICGWNVCWPVNTPGSYSFQDRSYGWSKTLADRWTREAEAEAAHGGRERWPVEGGDA